VAFYSSLLKNNSYCLGTALQLCFPFLYTFLIKSIKLRPLWPGSSVYTCGRCSDLWSRTVHPWVFCWITYGCSSCSKACRLCILPNAAFFSSLWWWHPWGFANRRRYRAVSFV